MNPKIIQKLKGVKDEIAAKTSDHADSDHSDDNQYSDLYLDENAVLIWEKEIKEGWEKYSGTLTKEQWLNDIKPSFAGLDKNNKLLAKLIHNHNEVVKLVSNMAKLINLHKQEIIDILKEK